MRQTNTLYAWDTNAVNIGAYDLYNFLDMMEESFVVTTRLTKRHLAERQGCS